MNHTIKSLKQSIKWLPNAATKRIFHSSNRCKSIIPRKLYTGFYTHRVIRINYQLHRSSIIQQKYFTNTVLPKPTTTQRIEFQAEINGLFDEYKSNGLIEKVGEVTDCEKCKIVTQIYLEPYTQTLLPIHSNIKCCVPILEEEGLLLSISNLTGVSIIELKEYFKSLAKHKIDEKDATQLHDSFQYDGQIIYCRTSEIASDLCRWIGPCDNHVDENIPIVGDSSYERL